MNVEEFIEKLGFLQYEGGGIEMIHADWPMYPVGHGVRSALQSLGNFPVGTKFIPIEEVDQCHLFLADFAQNNNEPLSLENFHVAIWAEDLQELHKKYLITGLRSVTAYDSAIEYYETMKSDPKLWRDRQFLLPQPTREMFDEPDKVEIQIVGNVSLTREGHQALLGFSSTEESFHPILQSRITPLIQIGYFDTAVREGCLLVECRLKEITGSDKYGQDLVNLFFKQWKDLESGRTWPSWKILRGEIRTIVKFLRNYYAHHCITVDEKQAYAFLARISKVLNAIDAVYWKRE